MKFIIICALEFIVQALLFALAAWICEKYIFRAS
jgi:hypothetical protein